MSAVIDIRLGKVEGVSDMSADHSPSRLLELPSTWLANLVQHVAPGAGGLANAAALSQTCKFFHALSGSPAVTYRNLRLDNPLLSLDHPFFRWLAKRQGRISGLTAELRLLTVGNPEPEPEQLQLLFGIPGLHLTLRCDHVVSTPDDPFITKVLKPHGHLIEHLVSIIHSDPGGLKLQDFCEAAAPYRFLDLTGRSSSEQPLEMGALNPVARSLVRLNMKSTHFFIRRKLESVSSLSLLSQLTSLSLDDFHFASEEPWVHLAALTNLKQLSLGIAASGDPSPLSALTGLSSLELRSYKQAAMEGVLDGLLRPCTFSSLQPLSTLQHLVELELKNKACSATSLHGLAELSSLKAVSLDAPMLRSLAGVNTGLTSLAIHGAALLGSLARIEHLQGLECLHMLGSGVTSLQPLAALPQLGDLRMGGSFTSLAGLEGNLCTSLHTLTLQGCLLLRELSGIEGLTALQYLEIKMSRVTSLQPIGQLVGGLEQLHLWYCDKVEQEVLELPHIQPTAVISIIGSTIKEVLLAGGVRRRVS